MPQELSFLRSNAEETDLRIWLHCVHSNGSRKMLYSPDTDVYNIGLPIIQELPSLEVYIELKERRKDSHRYLHLNNLYMHYALILTWHRSLLNNDHL